jgi:hypothetical protein
VFNEDQPSQSNEDVEPKQFTKLSLPAELQIRTGKRKMSEESGRTTLHVQNGKEIYLTILLHLLLPINLARSAILANITGDDLVLLDSRDLIRLHPTCCN